MHAKRNGITARASAAGLLVFAAFALPVSAVPPQLVSARNPLAAASVAGNDNSVAPTLTPDGRYVLFTSSANNLTAGGLSTNGQFILFESAAGDLVSGMTNGVSNIFVRDMTAGTNALVSVGLN